MEMVGPDHEVGVTVSYSPQFITGEPQFRVPTPSEREKIKNQLTLAVIFFFIAGLVLVIMGGLDISQYSFLNGLSDDALADELGSEFDAATRAEMNVQVSTYLITGAVKLAFGIVGFIFGVLVNLKSIGPLNKGEYEEAGRFLNLFIIMGFFFGLVLAGIFIFLGKNTMKRTAHKLSGASQSMGQGNLMRPGETSEEFRRCSVCNSMMTYNNQTRMWFCGSCNRYM